MFSDDEMKAAARAAHAATDLDQPGSVILRVTNRLSDAMPLDGKPLPLAICLSWAHWAIEDAQPSPLSIALAGEFDDGELYEIAIDIAMSPSTPARERLLAAIAEARKDGE